MDEAEGKIGWQKFIVHKANILDDDGVKRRDKEVVELSPHLARHYNKLGFLRPYFEDDEDDDTPPRAAKPVRPRRAAAQSKTAFVPGRVPS